MLQVDIIGDIHGCYDEFVQLTNQLGYTWENGYPLHPEGRVIGLVGDLTDRGPNSLKVIEVVWSLYKNHKVYYVPGNHCNKLYRYFLGNKVQLTHGLETTVEEYSALPHQKKEEIKSKFIELYEQSPLYRILDHNKLVIAHAGINEELIGKHNKKVKTFVLYGDITGETNKDGTPVRNDWAQEYKGKALIVYGHTPVKEPRIVNNTINIDTGAVFGGKLTAVRYPSMEIVSVSSSLVYVEEKFRSFT